MAASTGLAVTSVHSLGMGWASCISREVSAAAFRYSGNRAWLTSSGCAYSVKPRVTAAIFAASVFMAARVVSYGMFGEGKDQTLPMDMEAPPSADVPVFVLRRQRTLSMVTRSTSLPPNL